jgi:hypothetical protein
MLLASHERLTAYDNKNPEACPLWTITAGPDGIPDNDDDVRGNAAGRCTELYLYDAVTADLRCVSCNPEGLPPTANASLYRAAGGAVGVSPDPLPTNLSRDGSRVYFETKDALVASDSNGTIDVYEWHDGALSLVSSGTSSSDSHFADASPTGSDVFFLTREHLSQGDVDALIDLYDARIGGGFPAGPQGTPPCEGDTCRGLQSPEPVLAEPGSRLAQPDGDVKAPPGKRLSVKRLSKKTIRRLWSGHTVAVRVSSSRSGRLILTARATGRASGMRVAVVSKRLKKPGTVTCHIRIAAAKLRQMTHKGMQTLLLAFRLTGNPELRDELKVSKPQAASEVSR